MPEQAYDLITRMAKWTDSDVAPKPVRWVGSSKSDLSAFPEEVRRRVGSGLWDAPRGIKAPFAKPLRGFGSAGVLEIIDDYDGNTFRVVYTVSLAGVVYVVHAFQKKSKHGRATPKFDLDLINRRLKRAREDYGIWRGSEKAKSG